MRSLAIASVFILLDFSVPDLMFIGYDIFPDVIGLVFVLACSMLLMEKASSFARPVIISVFMLFLESVRIFGLAPDEILTQVLLLVYLFLKALLILFVLEAEAQICRSLEDREAAALAERVGLLYALTFPLRVGGIFLPEFQGVFWLLSLCLSVLTFAVLLYMYTHIRVPAEKPEEEPLPEDEGGGEEELEEDEKPEGDGETEEGEEGEEGGGEGPEEEA